ncbi:tetratricopeptide repeat protein [Halodesulfovibrio marinisediminis]|uniref:Flp pilus assembly protein TadD, contains TPR repeats n=1 Tax=Halodesulfovibrio marinisediminis DSM 17456 TaxID=1121457 RepID=A0A1N6DI54_9BACT|nr:tetratricopeptide repeat protein [Halodesulfovibrio marinisediminis]SIN70438.1 Flp pilus assembly protein TadD, contains TPR repeats [Halodesulfovibrio marinisediminis DSM 17456]
MDFKRIYNGAGALLLAVCFCLGINSPVSANGFVTPQVQQQLDKNDALYSSLQDAYTQRKWRQVSITFDEYTKAFVTLDLKAKQYSSLIVDVEEKRRKKRELDRYNSLRKQKQKEYVTAHGLGAIAYAHRKKFVAANDVLREVQEYGDEQAIIPAARGVIAYLMKDYNAAEPLLKTAHTLDSNLFEPVYYLYKIAFNKGEYGTAFFWMEKTAALKPERLDLIMAQAQLLQKLGQSSAAELMYTQLIKLDSSNAVAYNNRGYCRIALGKLDAAFSDFNSALAINDAYSEALLNRAALWRATGNLAAALKDLNSGLKSTPSDTRLLVSRMQTQQDMGNYVLAKEDMEQILLLSNSISAVNEAGWFLATCPSDTVRDGKRAVELLLPIVKRSKRHPRVLDSLAAAYAASNEFDKAVATQQEALTRGIEYRLPNYQLTNYEKRLALYAESRSFKTSMD